MSDADTSTSGRGRLAGFSVVSGLTVISRFAGLARDMLMAGLFGTGWILDTFTLAFRIPGLFRRLFGEGAMTAAFLPRFVEEDQQLGREAASALFSAVARQLARWLGWIVLAAEVVLLVLWLSVVTDSRSILLIQLTMVMLPYAWLICLAALHCAALNGVQHFLIPAFLPISLNIVWFAAGFVAMTRLTENTQQVLLIAGGIVTGGIVQLCISVRKLRQFGAGIHRGTVPPELQQRVRLLFHTMGPVLFGLSITQLNAVIDSSLAWWLAQPITTLPDSLQQFHLAEGTAAALYLGQRLFQFPLGVFGVALGTVLFPRFARHVAAGDQDELELDIRHGLQLVLVVGLPASAGLWLVADPITDLLFRYRAFGADDALLTSRMIATYGVGVWVYCGLLIANRVFYAAGDQWTPARLGLICLGLNLILNIVLLPLLQETALPLAAVLATLCQLGLTVETLRRRFLPAGYRGYVPVLWRSLLGVILMSAACQLMPEWNVAADQLSDRLLRTLLPVAACILTYWSCLRLSGLNPKQLMKQPF